MRFMLLGLILAIAPSAQALEFTIDLDAGQATTAQPGASGTGTGTASLDLSTNVLSWNFSFSGTQQPEGAAHFHQGAPGVSGGIEVGLAPLGSPKVGSVDLDTVPAVSVPADVDALIAGNWYANIHTGHSIGGEIRGQLVPVIVAAPVLPRALLVGLAGLLVAAAFWSLRRAQPAGSST